MRVQDNFQRKEKMNDLRTKYVTPAIDQTAFNCPHCGVLTTQFWFHPYANEMKSGTVPFKPSEEDVAKMLADARKDKDKDQDDVNRLRAWTTQMLSHRPFLQKQENSRYVEYTLFNLAASQCFNCKELALWIDDRLCWPVRGEAPLANPDLPTALRDDYDEASSILHLSARGAAALLRLVIQKLCDHLGEQGKTLDDAIASLVAKGLDRRVATALDIVRVVGNNAVHPGKMDLTDNRAIAENLFKLVNIIVEKMISEPKHLDEMYASLPEGARKHIEQRDGKKS